MSDDTIQWIAFMAFLAVVAICITVARVKTAQYEDEDEGQS